jgi:hypothetical protein
MILLRSQGRVVLLLAVVAAAGYGAYKWRNAVPSPEQHEDRRINSSAIEPKQASANLTQASAVPTDTLAAAKSLVLSSIGRDYS